MNTSQIPPDSKADENARALIDAEHEKLRQRVFEIENTYDAAILLVVGGAITFSATVVSELASPLQRGEALVTAWLAWSLCLVLACGGHLLSAKHHRRSLKFLGDGDIKKFLAEPVSLFAKSILIINSSTFVTLVVGFVAFGYFTFGNLCFEGEQCVRPQEAVTQTAATADKPAAKEKGGREHTAQTSSQLPDTSAPVSKEQLKEKAPTTQP
jgi:hypothetical protein